MSTTIQIPVPPITIPDDPSPLTPPPVTVTVPDGGPIDQGYRSAGWSPTPAPLPANPHAFHPGMYEGWQQVGVVSADLAADGTAGMAMDFFDGSSWASIIAGPAGFAAKWAPFKGTMVWGVPMVPGSVTDTAGVKHPIPANSDPTVAYGSTWMLTQGAAGAFDAFWHSVFKAFKATGRPETDILRMGWEFNGGWFPWAAHGAPAAFVAYWRRIVAIARAEGVLNPFGWNPTRGDLGVGDLMAYYPGDDVVDVVGLDIYDVEWANYPGAGGELAHITTQTYGLNWLAALAKSKNKQIALFETGLGWGASTPNSGPATANGPTCGGDNPALATGIGTWCETNQADFMWWDYGSSAIEAGANPQTKAALAPFGIA